MGAEPALKPRRGYPRKVEITRAVEAAKACGIKIGAVRIGPEGTIEIVQADAVHIAKDEFEQWEGRL